MCFDRGALAGFHPHPAVPCHPRSQLHLQCLASCSAIRTCHAIRSCCAPEDPPPCGLLPSSSSSSPPSIMSDACSISPTSSNGTLPCTPLDWDVIPPTSERRRRTLVLCFDGTGDQFDTDVCVCPSTDRMSLKASASELKRYLVLLHVDEGQPRGANGLLSGTDMHYSPPVRSSLTITAPPVLYQL